MLNVILSATAWGEVTTLVLAVLLTVGALFGLKVLRQRQWTDEWWEPFCEAAVQYVAKEVTGVVSHQRKQEVAIQHFRELYQRATGDFPDAALLKQAIKGIEVAYQIFRLTTNLSSGGSADAPTSQ